MSRGQWTSDHYIHMFCLESVGSWKHTVFRMSLYVPKLFQHEQCPCAQSELHKAPWLSERTQASWMWLCSGLLTQHQCLTSLMLLRINEHKSPQPCSETWGKPSPKRGMNSNSKRANNSGLGCLKTTYGCYGDGVFTNCWPYIVDLIKLYRNELTTHTT